MCTISVGENGCTMNVHLLCHLPVCVSDWGPLWCYSCFPFESVNGRLKTYYHGTRSMNKQLGFSYIVLQLLPRSAEKEPKRYVHNIIYIIILLYHRHWLLSTYGFEQALPLFVSHIWDDKYLLQIIS